MLLLLVRKSISFYDYCRSVDVIQIKFKSNYVFNKITVIRWEFGRNKFCWGVFRRGMQITRLRIYILIKIYKINYTHDFMVFFFLLSTETVKDGKTKYSYGDINEEVLFLQSFFPFFFILRNIFVRVCSNL